MNHMSRTGVVVVTHGRAAVSMVEAAERVLGRLDVQAVPIDIGEVRETIDRLLDDAVARTGSQEILFLVDLEGSTPFNLCCRHCQGRSVVLSGMNLAMLFKLATADRTQGPQVLADELMATGMKSIHVRPGVKP